MNLRVIACGSFAETENAEPLFGLGHLRTNSIGQIGQRNRSRKRGVPLLTLLEHHPPIALPAQLPEGALGIRVKPLEMLERLARSGLADVRQPLQVAIVLIHGDGAAWGHFTVGHQKHPQVAIHALARIE